ncbi:CGNR zinc finger domain-containing protein [Streptomyces sp. NA04227]|uniref:CGNR zinc finger domain-containing protein n=1 Tax=Streptomyces sp. NA04227 TaxID=2742136 RepID=UPI0015927227|nr:CGNR zinc finger domain-containing protein [Streptomyces sp. NA04227]QKW05131.1 CGNR zinc finger domain-containing protein [Streptomyces sp. NA04227]
MSWPATDRYRLSPAPGGLGLVQDLLNTAPAGMPSSTDLLGEPESAQRWADGAVLGWTGTTGRSPVHVRLREADLPALRRVRGQIRRALTERGQRGEEEDEANGLPAVVFTSVPLAVSLDGEAGLRLEPEGEGWRWIASAVLGEALLAQTAGTWPRLKICRNVPCATAFWDQSRNNSAVWHSAKGCGNAAHLRAARRRRKQREQEPADGA